MRNWKAKLVPEADRKSIPPEYICPVNLTKRFVTGNQPALERAAAYAKEQLVTQCRVRQFADATGADAPAADVEDDAPRDECVLCCEKLGDTQPTECPSCEARLCARCSPCRCGRREEASDAAATNSEEDDDESASGDDIGRDDGDVLNDVAF